MMGSDREYSGTSERRMGTLRLEEHLQKGSASKGRGRGGQ